MSYLSYQLDEGSREGRGEEKGGGKERRGRRGKERGGGEEERGGGGGGERGKERGGEGTGASTRQGTPVDIRLWGVPRAVNQLRRVHKKHRYSGVGGRMRCNHRFDLLLKQMSGMQRRGYFGCCGDEVFVFMQV